MLAHARNRITSRHHHTIVRIDFPTPLLTKPAHIFQQLLDSHISMMRNIVLLLLSLMRATESFAPFPTANKPTFTALSATTTLDGEKLRGPITPLGNFVLVRNKDTLAATSGGILLPDQVRYRG